MKSERILSIDVFRGFTIFMMIFVNDLAGILNIPIWMQHMPADVDGMTFVDLVFPAFLFIVGMSIPLAYKSRKKKGFSDWNIFIHNTIRTIGLIILGLFMLNSGRYNPELSILPKTVWKSLFYIGLILLWNQYPTVSKSKFFKFSYLKILGGLILAFLALVFRAGSKDSVQWFATSWWGILGLIGWAYLFGSIIFFIFKLKSISAYISIIVLLVSIYILDKTNLLQFLDFINNTLWLAGHLCSHSAIVVAGIVTSLVITENSVVETIFRKIFWVISFSVFLFLLGYLFRPLYGISKIYATPTWVLYSSGFCCLLFIFFYWLIDIRKIQNWTKLLQPAGSNPLLAYILPDIFYLILSFWGISIWGKYLSSGIPGIFRSFFFAILIVGITSLLGKLKIRLHL